MRVIYLVLRIKMTNPQERKRERKKGSTNVHVGAANVPGDLGGKPFLVKDTAGESTCSPPLDAEQRGLIVPGKTEALPAFQSSLLSSHDNFFSAMSPNHRPKLLKDDYKN